MRGYKIVRSIYTGNYLIAELKILVGSQTNEERKVIDRKYAKYRCDKAKVIKFYDINLNPIQKDKEVGESCCIKNCLVYIQPSKYVQGHIVDCSGYNENIDQVCAEGIHYFKSLEACQSYLLEIGTDTSKLKLIIDMAFYLQIFNPFKRDGRYVCYKEDGKPRGEFYFINGILHKFQFYELMLEAVFDYQLDDNEPKKVWVIWISKYKKNGCQLMTYSDRFLLDYKTIGERIFKLIAFCNNTTF